jgi:hypothetical protein
MTKKAGTKEASKDEKKIQTHSRETKSTQRSSSKISGCPHHFGYLSQRPRGEEIPEECMVCKKIVDCMVSRARETHITPIKSNSFTPEIESEILLVEEVTESAKNHGEETVKIELEGIVEPKIKTEPLRTEPSGNQFIVENVGMLYASWSDTVIIDRETLSDWGRKIKEVEIETVDGKRRRCKVKPTEHLKKGIVQIPDKVQLNLEIRKGELVTVKPVV